MDSPKSFHDLERVHSRIHSKTALYADIIKDIFLRPDKTILTLIKNISKAAYNNRGKILILGILGYMYSPEIGYFKNKGGRIAADEKTKKEFGIDSVYQTKDWETNTIIRLISGVADQKDIDSLVKIYGHKEAFDTLYHSAIKDTLFYKCYGDLLISLHNPHSTFGGDYKRDILGDALGYDNSHVSAKVEELESKKQIFNITDFGVFADTTGLKNRLDSSYMNQKKVATEKDLLDILNQLNSGKFVKIDTFYYKGGVQKLINAEVAEDGHISILHKEGMIRNYLNYAGNYIKNGFKQKTLYHKNNTVENQTHEEDRGRARGEEGILVAKLLQMYEDRMPINSRWHIERLITFYDGYFENYKDIKKAALYREKLKHLKK